MNTATYPTFKTRFSIKPQHLLLLTALTAGLSSQANAEAAGDSNEELPDIVVTAEFRESKLQSLASSVTVITETLIENKQAQHLEQVLGLAPNINFSSGASRGKYIQIRGIGERSQFVEPQNAAVGLLIDGIDFTGIAGAATTLDVEQIEILRGPQGTLFGANALAGLININSKRPNENAEGGISVSLGDYDTKTLSGFINAPVSEQFGLRLSAENHSSNGFIENDFLNKDDTNNIDETTLRAKAMWQANDDFSLEISALYVDVDNGYDAFSLDGPRHTLSDEPGHDRQESSAISAKAKWTGNNKVDFIALISHAQSSLEYGYDEDWAHPNICAGTDCDESLWGFDWSYASFDNYSRDNDNTTMDLRLLSKNDESALDWVAGVYYRQQDVDLLRTYTYEADFASAFDTKNLAVYGQLSLAFNESLTLVAGLRREQRRADYADNRNAQFSPEEKAWGGKVSLEHINPEGRLIYALLSRGYKAGGFNSDPSIPESRRTFDTEFMWNYEIGLKDQILNNSVEFQIALFYQDREDIQVKQSIVTPSNGELCPCDFTDLTDNAAAGINYGLEGSASLYVNESLSLFASLGLLRTEYQDYSSFEHVDADTSSGTPFSLDGRDQAHAPQYQFALGGDLKLSDNLRANLSIEGKDEFYFSSRHSVKSDSYTLINARLSYALDQWEIALWGRNLSDEDVKVRAFGSFGNDPRNFYATEAYYQLGEPRMIGVSGNYRF